MTDAPRVYPPLVKNERPTRLTARVRYWSDLLLRQSGKTVSSVARETGFSRTTVHRVFYGLDTDELLVGTVEAVAVALGVDPCALFEPMPGEDVGASGSVKDSTVAARETKPEPEGDSN